MENQDLLELLLTTPSPSGYELNIQKKIIDYMSDITDATITQNNYNVIHVLNPLAKTKILFTAHIDEIGLVINKINSDGTCSVEAIGGIRPYMYAGHHVYAVHNSTNIPAVFGYVPNMDKGISASDLILDLGTTSKEETKKLVSIGDPVIHQSTYNYLSHKRLAARALDDKIAAYIFLSVMKRLKGKTNLGIYVSTTVGEETTCRGAESAVAKVQPTCAIASDVTYASDINYRENLHGDISLGSGPVLTTGSLMNKKLNTLFEEAAQRLNITCQREVAPGKTWTDADFMYKYYETTPTYLISIPLRYMHSPVEVCDLQDVKEIIDLVEDFVLNFKEDTSFNPFDK